MRARKLVLLFFLFYVSFQSDAQQPSGLWHGIEREVHYKPDGGDFLLVQGTRRFNRALYGGNTAFRVEAGDLPEFAMYLPGMGGVRIEDVLVVGDDGAFAPTDLLTTTTRELLAL